jgi:hypothetical protein
MTPTLIRREVPRSVVSPDPSKKLNALLKRLRATYGEAVADPGLEGCPETADKLLWHLVFSFLAWEASTARAVMATKRLHGSVVDYNELRVCLNDELVRMVGDRYPRALERVTRLRSTLNDLYRREHAVSLKSLPELPKREARQLLDSCEGLPPFVSARMLLFSLGGHAFPLDHRIHQALLTEEAAPENFDEAAGWLERHFRVGEAAPAYLLIEAWMNDRPVPRGATRPGKRSGKAPKSPHVKKASKS